MSAFSRRLGWVLVGFTLAACSAPPATGTGGQSKPKPDPDPTMDAGTTTPPN
jgi:hypothetical protein